MTDLHAAADAYLTQRRSFGHKMDQAGGLLHQFIDHIQDHGGRVTTVAALEWATLPTTATAWWWRQRLSVVRGFARYLHADDPSVEVPPPGLIPARPPRATPHIYSDADIAALLAAAGRLRSPLRQATYQTLIGLLAATGMRPGEAIALDDADVDLAEGLIVVRHAKFDKTRLLVVHPTTVSALRDYRRVREQHQPQPATSGFLVSTVGTRLFYPNVSSLFRRLTREVGLSETDSGPRLHDFRHSWAVRWLVDWHRDGVDVGPRLAGLSTYLGHTNPAGSYWYLTGTRELLELAAQRLQAADEVDA